MQEGKGKSLRYPLTKYAIMRYNEKAAHPGRTEKRLRCWGGLLRWAAGTYWRSAIPLVERGGWLMWKQKLMKALLTLFWTVLMLVLLTTKAC